MLGLRPGVRGCVGAETGVKRVCVGAETGVKRVCWG